MLANSPERMWPPLFDVPAAGSGGSPAAHTRSNRRQAEVEGKEHKKKKRN